MLTEKELQHYGIDATRKANLLKLAEYLRKLNSEQFSMSSFYQQYDEHQDSWLVTAGPSQIEQATEPNHCGTIACAVGCGPAAGIPAIETDLGWVSYSCRVFVPSNPAWEFLFSVSWARFDNSPAGAAKRIQFLLKNGLKGIWPANLGMFSFFETYGLPY